jgi:hypothetical protein
MVHVWWSSVDPWSIGRGPGPGSMHLFFGFFFRKLIPKINKPLDLCRLALSSDSSDSCAHAFVATSRIFSTVCLVFRMCLVYYFIYNLYSLFYSLLFRRFIVWEDSRVQGTRLCAVAKWEARQEALDHIGPICFLSLVYTLACML